MQKAGTSLTTFATSIGLAGLLIAAATVRLQAQQAADPPPWKQGMPAAAASSTLAPVAPPPLPTAADKLPLDKLKVKQGLKIEVYAAGVPNARTLRLGDKGTVFVSSRLQDKVHALVTNKDGKRELKVVASGLHRPNGIALHKGTLYIAELSQISKIENVESSLDNPPKPTVILGDLPKDEPHGWKYLTVGPDEKLYFQVGVPCNICMPSDRHGRIYRVGLDGKGLETYAYGIRQNYGKDRHPTLKQIKFSENALYWLTEDIPEDKHNRHSDDTADGR
jgi:glucose/arabinose dehydrogenase